MCGDCFMPDRTATSASTSTSALITAHTWLWREWEGGAKGHKAHSLSCRCRRCCQRCLCLCHCPLSLLARSLSLAQPSQPASAHEWNRNNNNIKYKRATKQQQQQTHETCARSLSDDCARLLPRKSPSTTTTISADIIHMNIHFAFIIHWLLPKKKAFNTCKNFHNSQFSSVYVFLRLYVCFAVTFYVCLARARSSAGLSWAELLCRNLWHVLTTRQLVCI